ncbi:MAG: NAD(P)H-hydrate dehydratase [Nitrososphaerota archaeon]
MEASLYRESTDEDIAAACTPRRIDSRKGENGIVLVVGGSWLYHGAPLLSSIAALRTGVDLVYLAVPEKLATAVRAYTPSLIVVPLTDYKLTPRSVRRITDNVSGVTSLVVGPGLARGSEEGIIRLLEYVKERDLTAVLDATALFPQVLETVSGGRFVLTPHAGEFRRAFGIDLGSSLEERVEAVRQECLRHHVTVLLKGVVDVISDGSRVVVNRKGWEAAAMTVGGTGDVLAGLTAGLMAKGAKPFEAAVAGARVNGMAGILAASKKGFHITPEDVVEELPNVLKPFDRVIR